MPGFGPASTLVSGRYFNLKPSRMTLPVTSPVCPQTRTWTLQLPKPVRNSWIAEVVHDAPVRFSDPARYSFALGGKDGHPFPVPMKTYDRAIKCCKLRWTPRN